MMMKRRIWNVALFLTACCIAFPAAASDLLPFEAVIQTQPMPTGSCGIGCLQLEITGVGQGTHMGRIATRPIAGRSDSESADGNIHADCRQWRCAGDRILGNSAVARSSGSGHLRRNMDGDRRNGTVR
jgi:hypothetical protein